jgi:hypothetical protein
MGGFLLLELDPRMAAPASALTLPLKRELSPMVPGCAKLRRLRTVAGAIGFRRNNGKPVYLRKLCGRRHYRKIIFL